MEAVLRGLTHVCVYLDDILVMGESETAHLHSYAAVLEHLERAGIRLKRECVFMLPGVEYLGHRISAQGHPNIGKQNVRHYRCFNTN